MRRVVGVVLGVVLTVLLGAGSVALAIVAFPLADYRPPDDVPLRDEPVAVVTRSTRRTVTASVELEWSPTREIKAGDAAGKVTAVFATAGTPLACGAPVAAVDGAVLWALCGTVPLWRDVTAATKGADADAVSDLLTGLGQLPETDRSNGRRRAEALKRLQRFLGQPATGVLRPSDVLFIGAELTPSRVLVTIGDRISSDADLLVIDAALQTATVDGITDEALTASDWVFAADGSPAEFPISDARTVDVGAFEEVARSTIESPDAELPARIQGSVRLAEPISFVGVPPSALVTAPDGSNCVVLVAGGTTPVAVVDSATGMVMVDADLPEGTLIRNLPPASTTC